MTIEIITVLSFLHTLLILKCRFLESRHSTASLSHSPEEEK